MDNKSIFVQNALSQLGYKSKQDLYENLYLKAIVDSYSRIDKTPDIENNIRDRFIRDLEKYNAYTSKLINDCILKLNFEQWHLIDDSQKARTDIAFFISGIEDFIVECKILYSQLSKNKFYISDGLSRFIDKKYSKNNNYAAMMGFIVSGELYTIINTLKTQVLNIAKKKLSDKKGIPFWELSFISTHDREQANPINIYHLFFNFNKN